MRHCSAIIMAEATRVSQEEAGADDMKPQVQSETLDVMEKRNALVTAWSHQQTSRSHKE
jgi:hypothetical protein